MFFICLFAFMAALVALVFSLLRFVGTVFFVSIQAIIDREWWGIPATSLLFGSLIVILGFIFWW